MIITQKIKIALLIFFIPLLGQSQITKIRGVITDSETKETLPFVNVVFQGKTTGTVSNTEGEYFLETRDPSDSIRISFVGYESKHIKIKWHIYQEINIELSPIKFELEAVVVTPGENPAHPILRKVIKNKKHNNPDKIDTYSYEMYNKVELDINNVDKEFQDQRFLRDFQFIFDYVDTSAVSGKSYLPVMISESISDFYFQKWPQMEKEVIKASQISGINNSSISQFTGKMYQKINIYDNFITIFEPGFVSPISNVGLMYYKYYLQDSAFVDGKWCYHLVFVPKRKQERVFRGDFWVHDTTFAVKQIQMRLSTDANINYVNDFLAEYTYDIVDDSIWFMTEEKLFVDFNLTDRSTGFFGRKSCNYSNIKINQEIPRHILKQNDNVVVLEEALKRKEIFWDTIRPIELTTKEKNIYTMVDSVQQVPRYKRYERLVGMFVTYYYDFGPVEWGPYYKTYSFNEIEGHRLRFGGRTSNEMSSKIRFDGHLAYGTKDERFKYRTSLLYVFDPSPRMVYHLSWKTDMEQLGQSPNALTEDNIFTSLLRRNPNYKLTLVTDFTTYFEKEWFRGFSNTITFKHRRIYPTEYVPFQLTTDNGIHVFENMKTSEVTLNTRYAQDERIIMGEFDRVSLGTVKPIYNLNLTAGLKGIFESEYEYYKIDASIAHRQNFGPFGYLKYIAEGGVIFGDLPYPLLKMHEGNETYAFDRYAYNMMNYYEFASDKYLSLYVEHHFQGFFLNKVPLLQRLKLREVVSAKGLIGELSNRHQKVMDFPEGFHEVSKPYFEASVGLENILKIFRVDAVWRLSYLDHPDIQKFGLRTKVQIVF